MIELHLADNMTADIRHKANLIYSDCIYERDDFSWIERYWEFLKPNSIFIVQTDYHKVSETKLFLDSMPNSIFVNWVIYKQEWGGTPAKGFPMKHDDILIYANGEDWFWDKSRIEIPKATAGTKFDKKGTGLKTPCSVWDDLGNFSTMDKERIKDPDTGKNIRWQKPLKLMRRLMTPFLQAGDTVIDPFFGTCTTGVVAKELNCNFVGVENDDKLYSISVKRLGLEQEK